MIVIKVVRALEKGEIYSKVRVPIFTSIRKTLKSMQEYGSNLSGHIVLKEDIKGGSIFIGVDRTLDIPIEERKLGFYMSLVLDEIQDIDQYVSKVSMTGTKVPGGYNSNNMFQLWEPNIKGYLFIGEPQDRKLVVRGMDMLIELLVKETGWTESIDV